MQMSNVPMAILKCGIKSIIWRNYFFFFCAFLISWFILIKFLLQRQLLKHFNCIPATQKTKTTFVVICDKCDNKVWKTILYSNALPLRDKATVVEMLFILMATDIHPISCFIHFTNRAKLKAVQFTILVLPWSSTHTFAFRFWINQF